MTMRVGTEAAKTSSRCNPVADDEGQSAPATAAVSISSRTALAPAGSSKPNPFSFSAALTARAETK
jgi:hypothetical protein